MKGESETCVSREARRAPYCNVDAGTTDTRSCHERILAGYLSLVCFRFWLNSPGRHRRSLNFFNNWFVTGDYAVGGVGLRGGGAESGWATGTINMTGVPTSAQPIAAFLYWSTVETSTTPGATIGYFNGNQNSRRGLGNPQSPEPPCGPSGATLSGYADSFTVPMCFATCPSIPAMSRKPMASRR